MVCLNLYKWKMSSLKLTMKNNVNVHNCASNSFVKFFQRESYHKHHVDKTKQGISFYWRQVWPFEFEIDGFQGLQKQCHRWPDFKY
jgi:hypothetical protein